MVETFDSHFRIRKTCTISEKLISSNLLMCDHGNVCLALNDFHVSNFLLLSFIFYLKNRVSYLIAPVKPGYNLFKVTGYLK